LLRTVAMLQVRLSFLDLMKNLLGE